MTEVRLWKPADLVLTVCFLLLAGAVWLLWPAVTGDTVLIRADGVLYGEYPLSTNQIVTVSQGEHENVIEIADGSVRMLDASCPDHLCVRQGLIQGGAIVCLPNRVTVELSGSSSLDAVAS